MLDIELKVGEYYEKTAKTGLLVSAEMIYLSHDIYYLELEMFGSNALEADLEPVISEEYIGTKQSIVKALSKIGVNLQIEDDYSIDLSEADRKELKKFYIDLALQTKDVKWLLELTSK